MAAVRSLAGVSVEPQSGSERSSSGGEDSDSSESSSGSSSSSSGSSGSSSREEKAGEPAGEPAGDAEPMEVEEGELQDEEEEKHLKADLGAELVSGRRYENKAGVFITGIDVNSKEAIEKKEKRAQRFHFCDEEKKNQKDMVLDKEMMKKVVPNLRLEALHVSGVDDMSTQEVFDYFKEYPPAHIEWIDDTSCNVVWLDDVTSSRALINCSRMPDPEVVSTDPKVVSTETEVKGSDKPLPSQAKEKTSGDEDEDEEEGQVETEGAESADKVENNTPVAPPPAQTDGVSEADSQLSLQQADGVPLPERDSLLSLSPQQTDGVSLPERDSLLSLHPRPAVKPFKGNKLFMRFATHDDRKEPGASRRSRYYMKYGNPNYGGMRGILSNSWKRRYHSRRIQRDVKNKSPLIGDSPPYTRTHSADLVNLPEEDEDDDDDDDEDDMESDDRTVHFKGQKSLTSAGSAGVRLRSRGSSPAGVRLRSRGSSSGSDSEEMDMTSYDLQLKMISPAPSKTSPAPKKALKMTMYADQLVSSVRSESRLAGGLRGRIGGGGDSEPAANQTAPSAVTDIRQLLEEKRHRQQHHPVVKTDKTDVRQRLGKRRYHDRRSSSPEDAPPQPREPTRRYREDTPPPREPIKGKRRYHDPDTPPQPREPTRDVHSRLGVASQEARGLHSDWSKDRKTSRLWSRLGPSGGGDDITASSRRRKEAELPEQEAEEEEQEEEELQRMWGAMISKKQQRAGTATRGSRLEPPTSARLPSSRGSRLDQLPSLQIEISREEESSDDDI